MPPQTLNLFDCCGYTYLRGSVMRMVGLYAAATIIVFNIVIYIIDNPRISVGRVR